MGKYILFTAFGMFLMFVILKIISGRTLSPGASTSAMKKLINTQQFYNLLMTNEAREIVKTVEFREFVKTLSEEQFIEISKHLLS